MMIPRHLTARVVAVASTAGSVITHVHASRRTDTVDHMGAGPMHLRTLTPSDVTTMWRINEQGLPGVGQVSEASMLELLRLSELPVAAVHQGSVVGFVLCLLPNTPYGSPNYAWFNKRYDTFLYVDRIAVATQHRDRGVGAQLYAHIIQYADRRGWPVAAEVSLNPPNEGSMRFHNRHGFTDVGRLDHGYQTVTMLLRPAAACI